MQIGRGIAMHLSKSFFWCLMFFISCSLLHDVALAQTDQTGELKGTVYLVSPKAKQAVQGVKVCKNDLQLCVTSQNIPDQRGRISEGIFSLNKAALFAGLPSARLVVDKAGYILCNEQGVPVEEIIVQPASQDIQIYIRRNRLWGYIKDENGKTLGNLLVKIPGYNLSYTVKSDGVFSLELPNDQLDKKLLISKPGYVERQLAFTDLKSFYKQEGLDLNNITLYKDRNIQKVNPSDSLFKSQLQGLIFKDPSSQLPYDGVLVTLLDAADRNLGVASTKDGGLFLIDTSPNFDPQAAFALKLQYGQNIVYKYFNSYQDFTIQPYIAFEDESNPPTLSASNEATSEAITENERNKEKASVLNSAIGKELKAQERIVDSLRLREDELLRELKVLELLHNGDSVKKLQIQLELQKTRTELAQSEAKLKTLEIQNYQLRGGLIVISLFLLVLGVLLYLYHKRTVELRQKNSQLVENRFYIENLLGELNHRVKNHLKMIDSILFLKMQNNNEPQTVQALQDIQNVVSAMLLMNAELAFDKKNEKIDLNDYLQKLIDIFKKSFKYKVQSVDYQVHIDPNIQMSSEKALDLALTLNELITNAFKHAFDGISNPELLIQVKKLDENTVFLRVKDNGKGFPSDFNSTKLKSKGIRYIRSFCEKYRGELELHNNQGAECTLKFTI